MKNTPASALLPPSLTTVVEPITDWSERATPRAQTMADFRRFDISSHLDSGGRLLSLYLNSHAIGVVELSVDLLSGSSEEEVDGKTTMRDRETTQSAASSELEVTALKAALAGCWSLCNTLANLSQIHQERSNWDTGAKDKTWEYCWRLCQELYNSQDCDYASQINPVLDLCRDFCQTLFNGRDRGDDLADSILRVSFELNNHLYNTHDRKLPDAFRERTLDFYITLCHRLMKQRSQRFKSNHLLGACWNLAEMLFSIRQGKRENRQLDGELLGSAVQACWELCDIFREGWTRHRYVDPMVTPRHTRNFHHSDGGTPRPSQTTFRQMTQDAKQSERESSSEILQNGANPETPTTIFEETITVSPDDVPIQNIFVLGQGLAHSSDPNRPSSSSSASGQTLSSEKTTSTNTITTLRVEQNLKSIRALVMKAAVHNGFQPNGVQVLSTFTKSLSSDAFGSLSWQTSLLRNYKRLVAFDPGFRNIEPQHQASAIDIARAVQAIALNGSHSWLQDLYRLVFGFCVEEALGPADTLVGT